MPHIQTIAAILLPRLVLVLLRLVVTLVTSTGQTRLLIAIFLELEVADRPRMEYLLLFVILLDHRSMSSLFCLNGFHSLIIVCVRYVTHAAMPSPIAFVAL